MFVRTPRPAIRTAIRETSPDLIGISVQNLDAIGGRRIPAQRIRSFLLDIRMWIDTCRQESQAPIVLGGPAVSLLPREAFALWEPDFILAGDASRTFPELADRLERGDSYEDLPGLVRGASGEIRANMPGPWEAPRVPPRYEALDLPKYEAAGYGVAVLTKAWPYIRRDAPRRCQLWEAQSHDQSPIFSPTFGSFRHDSEFGRSSLPTLASMSLWRRRRQYVEPCAIHA
jgi:hypothetical protein